MKGSCSDNGLTAQGREQAIKRILAICDGGTFSDSWTVQQIRQALAQGRDAVEACRRAVGVGGSLDPDGLDLWHDSRGIRVQTGGGRTGTISYREVVAFVKAGGVMAVQRSLFDSCSSDSSVPAEV